MLERIPMPFATTLLLCLAPLQEATPPPAPAPPPPADVWAFLRGKYDHDGDGRITAEEHGRGKLAFYYLDRKQDGVLTAEDLELPVKRPPLVPAEDPKAEAPGKKRSPILGTGSASLDFTLRLLLPMAEPPPQDAKPPTMSLWDFRGKKTIALIFCSYSSPAFRKSAGHLKLLSELYGSEVTFLFVYTAEEHALDGPSPDTSPGAPLIEEALDFAERRALAAKCMAKLSLGSLTTLIDGMDNKVRDTYQADAACMFLMSRRGDIVYASDRHLKEFRPSDLERAIKKELKIDAPRRY